jgi:PKD repeat protein
MRTTTLPLALLLMLATATVPPLTPAGLATAGTGTPTFALYLAPSTLNNYDNAGEPSGGVDWGTGAVMFQAYESTYKVVFNDSPFPATVSWSDASSNNVVNIDPILATDRATGRTFAGGLGGACSQLSYTDNDGASWTPMGNPCSGTVDHETIGSGPWHGSPPLGSTYSRAVYYCAQAGNDACVVSGNGGLTFGAPVLVSGACSSLHGHVKVADDGTARVPDAHCNGNAGFFYTQDNGGSWSSVVIPSSGEPTDGFDPSLASTPDGTLYEAWQGADFHQYVAWTKDNGASWSAKVDLGALASPILQSTTFPAVVAGDNGRVAVAFLGTTTKDAHGCVGTDGACTGLWYLYVAYSYDAGGNWTLVQATAAPMQYGDICAGGSTGCPGNTRNLLDFMDAGVTKDGRVVVAFADGCPSTCTSNTNQAWAAIGRQSAGKGLFAAYDGSGPSAPGAPTLTSATGGNAQVQLAWTAPASNGGSPITNYTVYRATSSGAESALVTLGNVTSYTDASVANGVTYYYKVAATNAIGTGPLSNEKSATPTAPDAPPTACFTHSENGSTTSADGSCSSDSDGNVTAWDWNWGDGSTHGSGKTASHSYAAGGTYNVTLTVTDNGGQTNSTTQAVTVSSPPDQPPTACFAHNESGLQTSVDGSCSSDSDGSVVGWQWTFGDGANATGRTANHTYAASGNYTVTLTVTDNAGLTATTSQTITVTSDPDPSTPNLQSGVPAHATSGAKGTWQYWKIQVPSGASQLQVNLASNETCGLLSCNPDLDLYVRQGARPTTGTYDCASLSSTSNESCTITSPAAAWWYVGIYVYSGTKALAYTVTATVS